ncbi:MAG: hypothetical protein L6Q76_21575, partial [Polyangiaceae bacterium]|nr:hypothetical protein [Polyangiaceae bacterium]
CIPSPDPGNLPGTCTGTCATNYHDIDGDGLCEYYCVTSAPDDASCNQKDDDCDGIIDEDVDLCSSLVNCGQCGNSCSVLHGTPQCVYAGMGACSAANTQCQIQLCDPGFWDIDGLYATGCEYACSITNSGVEICGDGLDNDCDGLLDGADDLSQDPSMGQPCFGSPNGVCGLPANAGVTICAGNQILCMGGLTANQLPETCNGQDDDCDGLVDDSPIDAGKVCGTSNVYPCSFGVSVCQNGALVCAGSVNPMPETCNGEDDNCDGIVDSQSGSPPQDAVGPCNVPPPPPPGATSPCQAGTLACTGGVIVCQGSVQASSPNDTCGVDANCDGLLTGQPDFANDIHNCGGCGQDCNASAVHAIFACESGTCEFQGCDPGYYDLNNDSQCEYACIYIGAQEACNGIDDNCNGQVDESVIAPSPTQVCGVNPSATDAECTSQVTVTCQGGAWTCAFPPGVCSPSCFSAAEICDNLDNDCDGVKNENVPNWNNACASDDLNPVPGHGACRTTGTYVCNGPNNTICNAVAADCNTLPGGCTELCDGLDNDCDGLTDETFNNKGLKVAYYVKPAVTKLGIQNNWMFVYEASRPSATAIDPGIGNGYFTAAPAGTPYDKTPACSVPGKIPWFNVTPAEAEQICTAMGGAVCTTAAWQSFARLPAPDGCLWGYAPLGGACQTSFDPGVKFCNIGPSFDFDPFASGDQDGLLPAASPSLASCWADWSGQTNDKIFDMTGNLREITKSAVNEYKLMGGGFSTQSEAGAASDLDAYIVDQTFQFEDTGFRCCFTSDPSL